jgi:YVTN family beta-propeller protein
MQSLLSWSIRCKIKRWEASLTHRWRSKPKSLRWLRVLILVGVAAIGTCAAKDRFGTRTQPSFTRLFTDVGDFLLGSATDRTDYQSLDTAARRLYIAKMSASQLLQFDIGRNEFVVALDGFPKVTGVLVVPDLHKIYVSVPGGGFVSSVYVALGMIGLSSGRGAIAILDENDLHEIARLAGGVFPDGIAYDPTDRRIFVSDELGSAVMVIDADTDRVLARIPTGGEVGNVRYDKVTSKIYAPVQSRNDLAVIDPATVRLVAPYSVPGGQHPHGLAIPHGAAVGYVACNGNDRLLAVDLATGKILSDQTVAHDPDVLAIDPQAARLYVASGSGNLSSFDIADARGPVALGEVFVGDDAHSVSVDPLTHPALFSSRRCEGAIRSEGTGAQALMVSRRV